MKITRYLKLSLITAIIAFSWASFVVRPQSAAALTRTEQIACFNKYDGKDDYNGGSFVTEFDNSTCNKNSANGLDAGGNCAWGASHLVFRDNTKVPVRVIECSGGFTKAERGACYDAWNGKKFETGVMSETKFGQSLCNKDVNSTANCVAKLLRKVGVDPDGHNAIFAYQVSCTKPRGYVAGSSGGGSSVDIGSGNDSQATNETAPQISDSAVDGNVLCGGGKSCSIIEDYINPTIKLLSVLVGIVAVAAIIMGAIQVITSNGDPQKASAGKNHVRNAVIGLVSYVFLYAFLQWILPGGVG